MSLSFKLLHKRKFNIKELIEMRVSEDAAVHISKFVSFDIFQHIQILIN